LGGVGWAGGAWALNVGMQRAAARIKARFLNKVFIQ